MATQRLTATHEKGKNEVELFTYSFEKWTVVWFRDQWANGQAAADAMEGCEQHMDGAWPIACVGCDDRHEANEVWENLRKVYGINAMTYSPCIKGTDTVKMIEAKLS